MTVPHQTCALPLCQMSSGVRPLSKGGGKLERESSVLPATRRQRRVQIAVWKSRCRLLTLRPPFISSQLCRCRDRTFKKFKTWCRRGWEGHHVPSGPSVQDRLPKPTRSPNLRCSGVQRLQSGLRPTRTRLCGRAGRDVSVLIFKNHSSR